MITPYPSISWLWIPEYRDWAYLRPLELNAAIDKVEYSRVNPRFPNLTIPLSFQDERYQRQSIDGLEIQELLLQLSAFLKSTPIIAQQGCET